MAFASPWAGLAAALLGLLPLAALWSRERRASLLRRQLELPGRQPRARVLWGLLALLVLAAAVALAQPVSGARVALEARTDAAVYVVLDNTRSMLAAPHRGAPTRFARAQSLALALADSLPTVPFGVVTYNDHPTPALFPTPDRALYRDAVLNEVAVDQPPPLEPLFGVGTNFVAVRDFPEQRYFLPAVKHRVIVFVSDGESEASVYRYLRPVFKSAGIELLVFQIWSPKERVYDQKGHDLGYRPDARMAAQAKELARASDYPLFRDQPQLERTLARVVGQGPVRTLGTVDSRHSYARDALAVALAALLALALVALWPSLRRSPAEPSVRSGP